MRMIEGLTASITDGRSLVLLWLGDHTTPFSKKVGIVDIMVNLLLWDCPRLKPQVPLMDLLAGEMMSQTMDKAMTQHKAIWLPNTADKRQSCRSASKDEELPYI